MASERLVGGGGGGVSGGRHARVSPTPGRGSKIAYTPCPRSEPPQDLDLPVTARNCLAIPMSSLQTANGPGKGECKLISKLSGQRGLGGGNLSGIFGMQLCIQKKGRLCICHWQSLRFSATDIVLFLSLLFCSLLFSPLLFCCTFPFIFCLFACFCCLP